MSSSPKAEQLTPLMQQYYAIKQQQSDALLFFQVGDFYELFFDDARTASSFLGIALTKRGTMGGEPIPLCGVPVHALDHYLTKLIKGGFKVALCDQLEPAQPGKVVQRGVTRVFTPGTLVETQLLDEKSASYLCTFFPMRNEWALLFGELLTSQLFATTISTRSERTLESELGRFFPDEILIPNTVLGKQFQPHFKKLGYFTTLVDQSSTSVSEAAWMQGKHKTDIAQYIASHESMHGALQTLYGYLQRTQQASSDQFSSLHIYRPDDFLLLDAATITNLELVKNTSDGSSKRTLFGVLDNAQTPMGSRTIKKWLLRPLIKKEAIEQRQDVIEGCAKDILFLQDVSHILVAMGDIERVVGRIALGKAPFSDYASLRHAISFMPKIKQLLAQKNLFLLARINDAIANFEPLQFFLEAALNDDQTKTWFIKAGFDETLDAIRALVEDGSSKIVALEKKEQEKTGISSLKIRYNNVHGYYIEVTKTHMDAIPDYYKRQQTLVGRERYMTPELHELQHALFQARNEIDQREKEVFDNVKAEVARYLRPLRSCAQALAHLDALVGLAHTALDNNYVKPLVQENREIYIEQGRHPVIEQEVSARFIANDTQLNDAQSVWIITGPNMGGKSTYLRQVAHICIMAHIGSFIPAKAARIALLDRIFTRIGSGDNLAEGKSTFLVEMEETAAICTQATERSLVILDEVGRGTSTFDGLAIAQAVVEYIYQQVRARCLFATHYHELTALQDQFPGIVSYYAASKKTRNGIVFLYTMTAGVADGSFGVEVAKLAQLPSEIIVRAQEILYGLENQGPERYMPAMPVEKNSESETSVQVLRLYEQIQNIDYDNLSPKQAFDILWHMKSYVVGDKDA